MVKYSFIVPVYNCAKYLSVCVNSILAQVHESFEVLLIDDGSTDGSGAVCDLLASKNDCIRVFHKSNSGVSDSRNFGIQRSKGKYLIFVDSDDVVTSELLGKVSSALSKEPETLVIYGVSFDYYYKDKYQYSELLSCKHTGRFPVQQLLAEYQSFFDDNALSGVWNKVFSSAIIKKFGICFNQEMKLYEDYDFVVNYLRHIDSATCINEPLYQYRNDLGNRNLERRLHNVSALKKNMEQLMKSTVAMIAQYPKYFNPLADNSCNLYMKLLELSLVFHNHKLADLKEELSDYCTLSEFRSLLEQGASLNPSASVLLERIDEERFSEIHQIYQKRHMIYVGKKQAKSILRFLGLYSK